MTVSARLEEERQAFADRQAYQELMDRPYTRHLKAEVHRALSSLPEPPRRVLEVGSGVSEFLDHFPTSQLVLVDLSLELLRANPSPAHRVVCDGQALPFRRDVFDLIFYVGIVHHLADQQAGLEEGRRVMAREGRIFLCEPHRHSLNILYYLGRRLLLGLLGVQRMKTLIGCFTPGETQLDERAVRRVFPPDRFHYRVRSFLSVRLPPVRLWKRSDLDVRLSRILDRWPGLRRLGTTITYWLEDCSLRESLTTEEDSPSGGRSALGLPLASRPRQPMGPHQRPGGEER